MLARLNAFGRHHDEFPIKVLQGLLIEGEGTGKGAMI
jgi:hypothetical protein